MKIIGLTGGIGSGKSTVAHMFETYGIPVYNSDLRARDIMNESPAITNQLKEWYGDNIYSNKKLNRKALGARVFANESELIRLNKVVHPIVFNDFREWRINQRTEFVMKEAAILFESGAYIDCDIVITVSAPLEKRIERVMERDNTTRRLILDRIDKQWTDDQKEALSDYVITNDSTLKALKERVKEVFDEIVTKNSKNKE